MRKHSEWRNTHTRVPTDSTMELPPPLLVFLIISEGEFVCVLRGETRDDGVSSSSTLPRFACIPVIVADEPHDRNTNGLPTMCNYSLC